MRNRFKGLELIDRVPDELWTEVHDIVQEARIKTIPKKKKCKKAKQLSEEDLQIAVQRREVKSESESHSILSDSLRPHGLFSSSGFPYFLQFKSEFDNKLFMI